MIQETPRSPRFQMWPWHRLSELGKETFVTVYAISYLESLSIPVPSSLRSRFGEAAHAWEREKAAMPGGPPSYLPAEQIPRRTPDPATRMTAEDLPPEASIDEGQLRDWVMVWDTLSPQRQQWLVYVMAIGHKLQLNGFVGRLLVDRMVKAAIAVERASILDEGREEENQ